jgi:iron complex transport system ATP-binding protein
VTTLTFSGVSLSRRGVPVVREVSLAVSPGELVILVGPNGAGKTTLLRAALGLLRPDRGRVAIDDRDVATLAPRERAARIAWLPQSVTVSEPLTVLEHVSAARYRFAEAPANARAGATRALSRVDAAALGGRRLASLSGGERQRVELAAVLAQESPLLLLDEPANHLDPRQQRETFRRIADLAREGAGILCVTHDVGVLAGLPATGTTRVVGLADGRLAFTLPLLDPGLPTQLGALFDAELSLVERAGARALVTWWPNDRAGEESGR